MSSSDQNLKSQLSDLQKRLSQSTLNSPKRPTARNEQSEQQTDHHDINDPRRVAEEPSKKGLSNFLGKKDKRISLPVFDNSSRSLSSQTKSGGKDLDFVVGLSDNLLLECRRLQAENQHKSQKLKSVEHEIEKMRNINGSLLARLNEALQNEEKYKDTNWELEAKLQQVSQDFKLVTDNFNKAQSELNKQLELSHDIRSELDESNMNKATLERDFSSNQLTNTNQIQDLKSHIDELNDENYKLNDEIDELRKKLEESEKKPAEPVLTKIPDLRPMDDESSDEEFKEPPVSPVKTIPVNNTALESETLRGSLTQAHHTIAKLRAQILKLRSNELSSKQNSPVASKKSQNPLPKKSIRSLNEPGNRSFHVLKPSSNRSSKNIYEDSMDASDFDDDWENFEGDTSRSIGASPTAKRSRPISYTQDLIEDTDSDFDEDELKDVAPLSSELKVLSEEDVERYAEENGLVILPGDQYSKLIGQDLTTDAIVTPAKKFGFVSLPNDDPVAKEISREADLHKFAESKGLIILSKKELALKEEALASGAKQITDLVGQVSDLRYSKEQYAKDVADFKKKLEEAAIETANIEKERTSLREKVKNPSRDFITNNASTLGLHTLPVVEFKTLTDNLSHYKSIHEDPSHDFLLEKAQSKNLRLLPEDDHSSLLLKIKTFESKLSSKEKEVSDLEVKFTNAREQLRNQESKSSAKIDELEQQIASVSKERGNLKDNIKSLESKLEEYQSNNKELQSRIEELERESKNAVKERDTLSSSVKESESIVQQLRSTIGVTTKDKETLELTTKELKSSIEGFEAKIQQLESDKSSLSETVEKSEIKIKELESSIQKSETEKKVLLTTIGEADLKVKDLNNKIQGLESEKKELSSVIERAELKTEDLSTKIQVFESEKKDLSTTIEQSELKIKELEAKLEANLDNTNTLSSTIKQLETDLKAAKDEHTSVSSKSKELSTTLASLQSSYDEPDHDYIAQKATSRGFKLLNIDEHDKQISDYDSTVTSLKSEVAKLETSIGDLEKQVSTKTAEISSLSEKSKGLQRSIDDPSTEYINEKASGKGFKVLQAVEHERHLNELNNSIESLKVKLASESSKSEKKSEIANKLITELKEKVDSLEAEHKELVKNNANLQDELERATGELSIMKSQVENPTHEYLSDKSSKQGLSVLPKLAHVSLLEKAGKSVHDLAKEEDFIVLKQDDHDKLKLLANEPTLDHLSSKAEIHKHKLVPVKELDDLNKRANTTIEEHADAKGVTLVPNNEYKALQEEISNPSLDALHNHLKTRKHVALSEDNLKDLNEKANKTVEILAKEQNLVLLGKDEHTELLRKVQDPTVDELKNFAESNNHVLIPLDEHQSLVSKFNKSIDELASENDQIVVSRDDHKELTRKSTKPSIEELLGFSAAAGYVALHGDKHKELVNKSERSVHDLARESDHIALTNKEHQELLNSINSPSVEYLSSKGSAVGYALVKDDELRDITYRANKTINDLATEQKKVVLSEEDHGALVNPPINILTKKAKNLGYVTVQKSDYDSLVSLSKSPSLDFITSKAKGLGYSVVDSDDYDTLVKINDSPSKDFIRQKATNLGLIAVPLVDYNGLKEEAAKLKKDFADKSLLTEKLTSDGSVVLKQEDYDILVTKANTSLDDLAAKENKVVIPKEDHELLLSPSTDTISTHAARHGLLAVPKDTHRALVFNNETPSLDHLTSKALAHDHLVISKSDYEDLEKSYKSPSLEYLTEKAKNNGAVLVPSVEHHELKVKFEKTIDDLAKEDNKVVLDQKAHEALLNPSISTVRDYAERSGLVTSTKDEHEALLSSLESPSLDFLHKKVQNHSHVILPDEEARELREHKSTPSKEFLTSNLAIFGLVAVAKEEYHLLKEKASKSVQELASESGFTTVTVDDYKRLIDPTKETLKEKADERDMVLLEQKEYDQLLNPSKDKLSNKASELGLSLIPTQELETLSKNANKTIDDLAVEHNKVLLTPEVHDALKSPSNDTIVKFASAAGLVAITNKAFDELNSPSIDKLRELSAANKLQLIPKDEFEHLSVKSARTIDDLAKESNSVVLTKEDHASLENPSKDSIVAHAAKHGLVTLESDDHNALLHPSKDILSVHAHREGLKIIPTDEFELLVNPNKDSIIKKAHEHGLIAIEKDVFDDLKHNAESPSVGHVTEKAHDLGFVVLLSDEYDGLKSLANMPPLDHITQKATEYNMKVVPNSDYEKLQELAHSPDLEHLTSKSRDLGLQVLPVDEHKKLLGLSQSPPVDHLIEKAGSLGFTLLTSEDHKKLRNVSENPSRDFISTNAEKSGLVLIEKEKLEKLSDINSASITLIEPRATELRYLVVKKDKLSDVVHNYLSENDLVSLNQEEFAKLSELEKLPIDTIAPRATELGYMLVEQSKLSEFTDKYLTENDLVSLNKEEFAKLSDIEKLPIEKIAPRATALGFLMVEEKKLADFVFHYLEQHKLAHISEKDLSEMRNINSVEISEITPRATSLGYLVIEQKELNEFINSYLEEHNLANISKDDLSKLKQVDCLTVNEITSRAKDLGFVVVDTTEYDKITKDITKEDVISHADKFGLKSIPHDTYHRLANPEEDDLKLHAESRDLTVIPRSDYNTLLAQVEQPDKAFLEAHAATHGLILITQKEYQGLNDAINKVSKSDLEQKAKSIGHVLVPLEEFEQMKKIDEEEEASRTPTTPISKVAQNKDYFEKITQSTEKDRQRAKVFESARGLGFVPVAADEYKQLLEHQKDYVLTKSDIYKGAKEFNLSVLPTDEYKSLLKKRSNRDSITYDDLQAIAQRLNLNITSHGDEANSRSVHPLTLQSNESISTFTSTINESEFTDALERIPSNASTIRDLHARSISEDELRDQANLLGLALVPINQSFADEAVPDLTHEGENDEGDQDDEDQENDTIVDGSFIPSNRDAISRAAGDLGLVVIEQDEFDLLQNRELTEDDLKLHADKLGLNIIDNDKLHVLEKLQRPDESHIREASKGLGLLTFTKAEVQDLEEKAKSSVNPTDLITQDNVQEYANSLGLILLTRERFDKLVETSITSKTDFIDKAADFELVALDKDVYQSLTEKTTKGNGLSQAAIVAGASALGLSVLSSDELATRATTKESTKESVVSDADKFGLKVISLEEYNSLVSASKKTPEESDLENYASEHGFVFIPEVELQAIKDKATQKVSKEDIVEKSPDFDLVTLSVADFKQLKAASDANATPLLSKSDVVSRATEYDLVAVSKEELEVLRNKAGIKSKENLEKPKPEPPLLSKEDVEAGARTHGLLAIPENSFIATNISRIPDVNNVVVLPVTYYNKLTKSESLNVDKISNDELQAQAKKRGFHITYGEPEAHKDSHNLLSRKSTLTSLATSNSRRNLAEAAASAAYQEYENQPRSNSHSSSRAHSINRSGSTIHQRDVSIDGGISLITNASLSEPSIIPALTQTVIGEYLFKYYRRLGPLSSISESRHERYFWIHPYTLTLYWSSTNPVLGNPSTHKTRAAAIIGVESIEDNNPLPAGLHHKSIIVHSQSRSIKITCPTRQRHNIWYNSLRYLIQRSMDGINLEDDLDLLKDNSAK
ncbi:Nuclear migration protein NUM1 [Wickerhamomyces ciferrii]|uniref:Nuclear migration protein NUM1 n=1 Tax=Wickerhamomyces ciferrii (strain ATCC 14091 / BCRC 22168 / CBS 111 / JCM 3599 / NBRC 0793 / NRRL Y-1031 F-60-10) TaxID=1206466 RepID=K0KF36_WICCF|nr:Nuclear migration protein NUM1 [Wickerhamomyces ciferrii]CCH43745.1 Nuclear migration protein NUM1 [Wickerhamomyces ciferrii]